VPSITVPVRQVTRATPRTRLLHLDVAAVDFSFTAGQAVMIGLHGSALRKPYSIASAPWEVARTGVMQVLVQIEDSGGLDPHLELAAPGTQLDVEGPFGTFAPPAQPSALMFIAGGTGIAPLRSIMMARLQRPSAPPIVVVYSARSVEEFAFRLELEALQIAGRITTHFTVTRDESAVWPGRRGRIDHALLKAALPSDDADCFICGPPALVSDARQLLEQLGVPESRIQIERY
jgi:ferredoxin-NADP reductase